MDLQEFTALLIVFFVFMRVIWSVFSRPTRRHLSQWLLKKGQVKLAMRVKF